MELSGPSPAVNMRVFVLGPAALRWRRTRLCISGIILVRLVRIDRSLPPVRVGARLILWQGGESFDYQEGLRLLPDAYIPRFIRQYPASAGFVEKILNFPNN